MKGFSICILVSNFLFLIFYISALIWFIWANLTLNILGFISLFVPIILIIEVSIYSVKKIHALEIVLMWSYGFFCFFYIMFIIIICINFGKYKTYRKICPFTVEDKKIHFEKKCQLYKINQNHRYSYQYICSYDSSKGMHKKIEEKINYNSINCIEAKSVIETNENVLDFFYKEYPKEKKYYCARANIPMKNTFINDINCTKGKYKIFIMFFILLFIFYGFPFAILIVLMFQIYEEEEENRPNRNRPPNHIDLPDDPLPPIQPLPPLHPLPPIIENDLPENNIGINRINRIRINWRRLVDLFELFEGFVRFNVFNINNSTSHLSTQESEKQNEEEEIPPEEEPKNIIVENKEEYTITTNINNLAPGKSTHNSIIRICDTNIINSEDIIINGLNNDI